MIAFRGATIQYHCHNCNTDVDITALVEYLRGFSIWKGYEKVPNNFYHAWKILVLGTDEYAKGGKCGDGHHDILKRASEDLANKDY
jgi:hypothetical protein